MAILHSLGFHLLVASLIANVKEKRVELAALENAINACRPVGTHYQV